MVLLELMERKELKDRQMIGLYCKDRLKKSSKIHTKTENRFFFFTVEESPYLFLVFFIYTCEKSALLIPHRGKKKSLNENCAFPK